jgi:hypothetical protein
MRPTLSDQLAECAHELELMGDAMAEAGLSTRPASAAAALLEAIAERVRSATTQEQLAASAVPAEDVETTHPRELLALSGKQWDFALPGCETFGCIDGKTDAETYRQSHERLCDRLRDQEPDGYREKHHLLEAIADRWDAFSDDERWRWDAASHLIGFFGRETDAANYEPFATIPRMAAELILTLDTVEYEEYNPDCDGVSRRQARAAADDAQRLADTVKDWADAL